MQSLLRWSIENSEPTTNPDGTTAPHPEPRKDLDPGIIDLILGKPDAVLMKEALAVAIDESRSEDERVNALDQFEMLVEQIDNANNLKNLKMWEPLQSLLTSPSSSNAIKTQVLWVLGTAVQNNPAAQHDYLALSPLSDLLGALSQSTMTSPETRAKAVYALSGLLKHNAAAVDELESIGGWEVLRSALQDSSISVRRKTAFLLNTLLIPSSSDSPTRTEDGVRQPVWQNSHASALEDPTSTSTAPQTLSALHTHGILHALVSALTQPVPYGEDGDSGEEGDVDFDEKVVRLLHTYAVVHRIQPPFSEEDKRALRVFFLQLHDDRWGLSREEGRDLLNVLLLD